MLLGIIRLQINYIFYILENLEEIFYILKISIEMGITLKLWINVI